MNEHELRRRFPNISQSALKRNCADSAPSGAEPKSDSVDESVAADAGKVAYEGRCLIRITSFRLHLCDERNLYDKHFVDALKEAGCFVDDSPQYVKVEVVQEQVYEKACEHTRIEIEPILG